MGDEEKEPMILEKDEHGNILIIFARNTLIAADDNHDKPKSV